MARKKESNQQAPLIRVGDLYEITELGLEKPYLSVLWHVYRAMGYDLLDDWQKGRPCLLLVNWIDEHPPQTACSMIEVSSDMKIVIPRELGVHCRMWEKMLRDKKIKLLQRAKQ